MRRDREIWDRKLSIPRALQRGLSLLLLPVALACLAFPFAQLFLDDGAAMIDDTRAWFGAGTAQGVPAVTQVRCLRHSYGMTTRGPGASEWACSLYLEPPPEPAGKDPWAGLSYEEAMAENDRRIAALAETIRDAERLPAYLERVVASDRSGDIPALRRLSAAGAPPRFGVVWSGWEIAGRWLHWAFTSALFLAIGLVCLYAVRRNWRRDA